MDRFILLLASGEAIREFENLRACFKSTSNYKQQLTRANAAITNATKLHKQSAKNPLYATKCDLVALKEAWQCFTTQSHYVLGLLTQLTVLYVPNCDLRGTLPPKLCNLRELNHLELGREWRVGRYYSKSHIRIDTIDTPLYWEWIPRRSNANHERTC